MNTRTRTPSKTGTPSTFLPASRGLLQRKCACGGASGPSGECAECRKKRLAGGGRLPVQTKLTIGRPGDKYEQEADRVADAVMRMPEPRVQRLADPEEDKEEAVNAKSVPGQTPEITPGVEASINSMRSGGGQPLDPSTRAFMEPRFGVDFSRVRVHTGSRAVEAARALHARAFTVGRDVAFGSRQFAPGSGKGRRLLAHELTHVVQQEGSFYLQRQLSHDQRNKNDNSKNDQEKAIRKRAKSAIKDAEETIEELDKMIEDSKTVAAEKTILENAKSKVMNHLAELRQGLNPPSEASVLSLQSLLPLFVFLAALVGIHIRPEIEKVLPPILDKLERGIKEAQKEASEIGKGRIPHIPPFFPPRKKRENGTMRFQIHWVKKGKDKLSSGVAVANDDKGVRVYQAIAALYRSWLGLGEEKVQKASKKARDRVERWVEERPLENGVVPSRGRREVFQRKFTYKEHDDSRIDVENPVGHNLRF